MTRKRFIKLLMSQGKSRNEAVQLAQRVTETGYSYQRVYDDLFYLIRSRKTSYVVRLLS